MGFRRRHRLIGRSESEALGIRLPQGNGSRLDEPFQSARNRKVRTRSSGCVGTYADCGCNTARRECHHSLYGDIAGSETGQGLTLREHRTRSADLDYGIRSYREPVRSDRHGGDALEAHVVTIGGRSIELRKHRGLPVGIQSRYYCNVTGGSRRRHNDRVGLRGLYKRCGLTIEPVSCAGREVGAG